MASSEPLLPSSEDGFKEFSQVVKEERECIDGLHAQRVKDEAFGGAFEQSEPFSLAFSGGGIRAAAFQAGVLWRLAEMNRLKDVEYFTAVSGGGYITSAFASHCIAAEPPQPGQVKQWYLDVVSKTITRMQDNGGNFVRDCIRNPGFESEGAGVLPRIFDLPILLVTLCCTLLVNPVTFVVVFVVPTVFAISAFYGAAMRAAFCVPPDTGYTWWDIYYKFSPLWQLMRALGGAASATAVVFFLQRLVPSCKLGPPEQEGGRPTASKAYLLGHAAYGCLQRMTIAMAFFVLFLFLVPCLQTLSYDPASRMELCNAYIAEYSGRKIDCSDAYNYATTDTVAAAFTGDTWYRSHIFANYTDRLKAAKAAKESVFVDETDDHAPKLVKGIFEASTLYLFFVLWLVLLMFAVFLLPLFGSHVLVNTLFISGPALLMVALMAFVQYSVFGPITKNRNGIMPYDREVYRSFVSWSLAAAFILIPFYEELRAALHTYYKRCLQENYFCGGKDVNFKQVAEHPYCPFVILTGTSSDFQPPGDHDVISELSFSALHTGSEETSYIETPEYRSLGKCTALTGAGCLDAISLSMSDALALRFWLEVLNLSWGDYILFQSKKNELIDNVADVFGKQWKGGLTRLLHRIPSGVVWMLTWIWLLLAWHKAKNSEVMDDCQHYRDLLRMAATAIFVLIGLSFFSFLPVLDWLSMSPLLRQLQQATKYFYVGKRPPQMLYVTDGGVKDCTALVQLMRRKQKRILLVLAAADPHDDLGVLKAAMEVAKEQKIGCFYDPVDPRRDLGKAMAEYKEDRSIPYLHIGISYCWPEAGEEESTGHLYIVKNRLPPDHENQPVPSLLTMEEVVGQTPRSPPDAEFGSLTTEQLGPFGCCDCCHTNGLNCGPKFPHGSFTGYMYLTPQWSNNLTRLGYALSEQAISRVTARTRLNAAWEANI